MDDRHHETSHFVEVINHNCEGLIIVILCVKLNLPFSQNPYVFATCNTLLEAQLEFLR